MTTDATPAGADTQGIAGAQEPAAVSTEAPIADQLQAPTAPSTATPAVPGQSVDADRIAAAARKDAERKFADELAARDARLAEFEKAEEERRRAELSDAEKRDEDLKAAAAEAARLKAEVDARAAEAAQAARTSDIARRIAASNIRVPANYQPAVYLALAETDELTQATVDAALTTAETQFKADLEAFGVQPAPQAPPPQSVGSPGAVAVQPPRADVTPEQQAAEDEALVARMANPTTADLIAAAERWGTD